MADETVDYGGVNLALWTAGASIFALVFGLRGLWQYFHGSRADSADPVVASFALLTVPWLASITARLLRKHDSRQPLLSAPLLLLFSLAAIAGAIWYWLADLAPGRLIVVQLFLGFGGLALWLRRVRTWRTGHPSGGGSPASRAGGTGRG